MSKVSLDESALPSAHSSATKGFTEKYMNCYDLIIYAERNALDIYASTHKVSAKQKIICARVAGGFLIHLHNKRRILGDLPAGEVVSQILSGCEIHAQPLTQNPTEPKGYYDRIIVIGGSMPTQDVIYQVGQLLCDCLIYAFRSSNKVPTPRFTYPSWQSFTRLEDMLAQTMEASGNDYQTAREKVLARDGYQCMITGVWDTNSLERNMELNELLVKSRGYEATVKTCHILSQSIMEGIGDQVQPNKDESMPGLHSQTAPSSGVTEILTQFHLGHLDDMYEVRVVRDGILGTFSHVNRQPHFKINEMLKKQKFRHVHLALPDSRFLTLYAVCAHVAYMSGAVEYFNDLEWDAEDAIVVTEDSVKLLYNLLSLFTAIPAY
ncbi:hypothetical protein C8J55DRAFT_559733 [Lentinula edodes]|uniref:Uncharacterized protein n=1 Tax=Lentinula lateritia TaxID=40482 RepID=A0A9W9DS94_9AGAR|nr:hypothetical protein C8J55DRAFT_559733 [Lentinula edodes]